MSTKAPLFFILSLIVLGLGSFLIVENFDKEQIKIWDEASSAQNAIDMLAGGNYITQYSDGKPVRDDFKPPLSLWLKMICYSVFGINEFSVRLPSIIAALLTMLMLWYFGAFVLKKPELGLLFALFLICARGYVYYHVARTGDPDSLLIFFTAGALLAFYQLLNQYPKRRVLYYWLFGIWTILAIYTKGIMGIAPMLGLAIYTLLDKNGRKILLDYRLYTTIFIVFGVAALYYFVRELIDPGYIKGVLKYEIFVLNDYPLGKPKHPKFIFYFDYLINKGFKPFFYFIPLSIFIFFYGKNADLKKLILFSFLVVSAFLMGMSFSITKNEWYISQVYPFLSILVSSGVYGLYQLVKEKINAKYQWVLASISVIILVYICWEPVRLIHKANNAYKHIVYHPEREGRFLKKCKNHDPDLLHFDVITKHHLRQIRFYEKKYKYEDDTKLNIYRDLPINPMDKTILTCDRKTILQIFRNYETQKLNQDEFCYLLEIIGEKKNENITSYFCDVETISLDGLRFIDNIDNSITYYNGGLCDTVSYSGRISAKTLPGKEYNLNINFIPKPNQNIVQATVWRKAECDNGFLVVQIPDLDVFAKSKTPIETKGDWEFLETIVMLPAIYNQNEIRVFVWNPSDQIVYFDDLKVLAY